MTAGFEGPLPDHVLRKLNKADRPKGVAGMTKKEIEVLNDERTEKDIHDNIEAYLRRNAIPYDHSRMDKRTTNKRGHPDFSIYLCNHVLFIEVKKPDGKLSEVQKERIDELQKAGCMVWLCFSYEEAKRIITKFETQTT